MGLVKFKEIEKHVMFTMYKILYTSNYYSCQTKMIFYGFMDLFEINKTVINGEFIVNILLRTIILNNLYRHFGISNISVLCI